MRVRVMTSGVKVKIAPMGQWGWRQNKMIELWRWKPKVVRKRQACALLWISYCFHMFIYKRLRKEMQYYIIKKRLQNAFDP